MKMLRQIINRESLENSQENVSDKVYLLESCKSTLYNCNSTINKLQHRIFPEYVPETCYLKNNFFKKK